MLLEAAVEERVRCARVDDDLVVDAGRGEGPPELPDFKMPVAPGDHVLFPRSAGVWVEVEDERLLVCRVREILGVIEAEG